MTLRRLDLDLNLGIVLASVSRCFSNTLSFSQRAATRDLVAIEGELVRGKGVPLLDCGGKRKVC